MMKVVIIDRETGEILFNKYTDTNIDIGAVLQSPFGGQWRVVAVEHPVAHLLVENAGEEGD